MSFSRTRNLATSPFAGMAGTAVSINSYRIFKACPIPGAETLSDGFKAIDTEDWVAQLDLDTVTAMHAGRMQKLMVLVLYGSLRER